MRAEEAVGEGFSTAHQHEAQRVTWRVLEQTAQNVRPGHCVADVRALLERAMAEHGVDKAWHPPQLRLGASTCCPFNAAALSKAPLEEEDIFFLDLGLIVQGHEGDCGRTFTLGDNAEMQRCAADAQRMHAEGVAKWCDTQCTGKALYAWARERASELGWQLALHHADGHRIGDLPHRRFFKGNLAGRSYTPASERWIFEVQLLDPQRRFGAFYEDMLSA